MAGGRKISKIIVVGAGPAGLVLALLLAKEGINVQVLDAASKLDESPRASHYPAPAVYELERAGVIDEIRAQGMFPNGVSWRKLDGTSIATLSMGPVPVEQKMCCLPLNRMCKILLAHIERQPTVNIKWSHKVTNIGQDADKAWVTVDTPTGIQNFDATYIVGCDGANSQIRKSLFGNGEFPGRTWDEQIVATNVYYDMSPYKWDDSNFIIHPEHWSMIAKIQTDGLLRITYGEKSGLTREELIARQPMKFKAFVPGAPDPDKYKIVSISPYKIHQKCAERLRVGRFLLAADAAHLCNPFGGLGLTGGLVDIGNLYDCFYCINEGLAGDSILDRYDEVRREKYRTIIDPLSSENIRRLWQNPDEAGEKDAFLAACNKAAVDPKFAKAMQKGASDIMHDFRAECAARTPEPATPELTHGNLRAGLAATAVEG